MLNKVLLIGHLGMNPEIINTNSGHMIAKLSVATSEKVLDADTGDRISRTEWHNVVVISPKLAEVIKTYLANGKGQLVYIEGLLRKRKWTDDQNNIRSVVEVVINTRGKFLMLGGGRRDDVNHMSHNSNREYDKTKETMDNRHDTAIRDSQKNSNLGNPGHSTSDPASSMEDDIPF